MAEYYGNRVSERDLKGQVSGSSAVTGPLVAQRLAERQHVRLHRLELLEFDKDGKEVLTIEMPGDRTRIMKAMKLPNGEIACLTNDARVVRLDAKGKELHGFACASAPSLFGGRIDMLPSGRVLVPHNAEDKVVEYDGHGKAIWEVAVDKPIMAGACPTATRLSRRCSRRRRRRVRPGRQRGLVRRATTRVTRALRRVFSNRAATSSAVPENTHAPRARPRRRLPRARAAGRGTPETSRRKPSWS